MLVSGCASSRQSISVGRKISEIVWVTFAATRAKIEDGSFIEPIHIRGRGWLSWFDSILAYSAEWKRVNWARWCAKRTLSTHEREVLEVAVKVKALAYARTTMIMMMFILILDKWASRSSTISVVAPAKMSANWTRASVAWYQDVDLESQSSS